MLLQLPERTLDLSQPQVMGIVNVTPDSFSDGGRYFLHEQALAHALRLVDEGATLIDIGGESTRPGAAAVSVEDELARIIPVIKALRQQSDVVISIDTSKPEVMTAAVAAGAELINDIWALRLPGALEAAAKSGAAVCLMHMQGEPRTMQQQPHYCNVVAEVQQFLQQQLERCQALIDPARIVLDPGFGFGKSVGHNFALLQALPELQALQRPLLAGLSRKSMLGAVTGRASDERLAASVAAATLALAGGAHILRVHDVAATLDAVAVFQAMHKEIPA